jgi:hypothetical protein
MKTKSKGSPKHPHTRWRYNEKTGGFETLDVRIKVVGSNIYYFQGKKQITDKLFPTEKEAIYYQMLMFSQKVDQVSAHLHLLSSSLGSFITYFAGADDRARERASRRLKGKTPKNP